MLRGLCVCSEWSERVGELCTQLSDAYRRLSRAAERRATTLDRCLQLRLFEDGASTVRRFTPTTLGLLLPARDTKSPAAKSHGRPHEYRATL